MQNAHFSVIMASVGWLVHFQYLRNISFEVIVNICIREIFPFGQITQPDKCSQLTQFCILNHHYEWVTSNIATSIYVSILHMYIRVKVQRFSWMWVEKKTPIGSPRKLKCTFFIFTRLGNIFFKSTSCSSKTWEQRSWPCDQKMISLFNTIVYTVQRWARPQKIDSTHVADHF